jgi:hypothetical protein
MSFKLFPQLPPEIRIIIWKASLPGPRIFGQTIAFEELKKNNRLYQFQTLPEAKRDPAALFVNCESREVALKRFTQTSDVVLQCFYRNHLFEWVRIISPQYVDYSSDVAAFEWDSAKTFRNISCAIRPVEWDKLTRLVLTECPVRGSYEDMSILEWVLRLSCLRELTIDCSTCDPHIDCGDVTCDYETLNLVSGQRVRIIGADDAVARYAKEFRVGLNEAVKEIASARRELSIA